MQDPRFQGHKVLVTGAAGFIGTHLCRRLDAAGADVHAVSRRLRRHERGNIRYERVDLTDLEATRALLRRVQPSMVIHLAGRPAAARDAELVVPTLQSNLTSTVHLLVAAQEQGAPRVVLPGSLEEPEPGNGGASSPYAMSKWAASRYGLMFHELYRLPVAIARIFMTYGPTHRDLHKLMPYVILSLLDGQAPRLSSGRREVDWIHVDDVVDGLLALATAPAAPGQTLDLGSGRCVSIRAVVEELVRLIDPPVRPVFDPALDRSQEQLRVADVERTRHALGWAPRIGLNQGLAETVEWFRRHREKLRQEQGRRP